MAKRKEPNETLQKIDAFRSAIAEGPVTLLYWDRELLIAPKEEMIGDEALVVCKRGKDVQVIPWTAVERIFSEALKHGWVYAKPPGVRKRGLVLIQGGLADSIVAGPVSKAPLTLILGGRDESVRRREVRGAPASAGANDENPNLGA